MPVRGFRPIGRVLGRRFESDLLLSLLNENRYSLEFKPIMSLDTNPFAVTEPEKATVILRVDPMKLSQRKGRSN